MKVLGARSSVGFANAGIIRNIPLVCEFVGFGVEMSIRNGFKG